jgi:peptide/nickel transport system permease protein
MATLLLRRVLLAMLTIWVVVSMTFVLIHVAPGEPFAPGMADPRVTPEMRAAFRARYGLDRSPVAQYLTYLSRVARGDLGDSFSQGRPVASVLRDALPRTLLLMGTALALGLALGMGLGVWQALRPGGWSDRFVGWLTVGIGAIPDFWIALGLLLLFGLKLRWFPIGGMTDATMYAYLSPAGKVADIAKHLVLPGATLSMLVGAIVARHQRAALLDVLPENFMRTALAKGLSPRAALLTHAVRNALLPTITLLGLMLPALVGGAVFVETIYSWPGLGQLAVSSIASRDHPLVLGATVLASALVVIGGILADVLTAAIDPRLRRA